MPEGDTIFRTATVLRKAMLNEVVTGFSSSEEHVRNVVRSHPVVGRRVESVTSLGKNLMIVLRDDASSLDERSAEVVSTPESWGFNLVRGDLVLHTHLRMTGSWHLYRQGEAWRKPARFARVVVETAGFVAPCFSAPVVELLTAREAVRHPMLTSRGSDVIKDTFDPVSAFQLFRKHNDVPIGVALMNQRLMAGVGNVYKSEVMFIRRINPFAPVSQLGDEALEGMIDECHRLLQLNQSGGLRRTRFGLNRGERMWVYGRSGEPCSACGTLIKMKRQGLDGRSTYYCPKCQTGEQS